MSKPILYAVMDVSGSVNMNMKQRFFAATVALRDTLIVRHCTNNVELKCVRHHTSARDCELNEFLTLRETGGTIVSSALKHVLKDIKANYANTDNPIYLLVMGDGDNWNDDNERAVAPALVELNEYLSDSVYIEATRTHELETQPMYDVMDQHGFDCYEFYDEIAGVLADIEASVYILETVRPEPEPVTVSLTALPDNFVLTGVTYHFADGSNVVFTDTDDLEVAHHPV